MATLFDTPEFSQEPNKADVLAQAKQDKVARLEPHLANTKTALDLQTELSSAVDKQIHTRPDGTKFQYDFQTLNEDGTYADPSVEIDYTDTNRWGKANTRNLYIDNTREGNYKLGLARSDNSDPFLNRYMDKRAYGSYDGRPGVRGVTPQDGALLDIELPYDTATQLEYNVHSNKGQINNRVAGVTIPEIDKNRADFGPGISEYTTPNAPMWNIDYKIKKDLLPNNAYMPHVVDGKASGYTPVLTKMADQVTDPLKMNNLFDSPDDGTVGELIDNSQSSIVSTFASAGHQLLDVITPKEYEDAPWFKAVSKFTKDWSNTDKTDKVFGVNQRNKRIANKELQDITEKEYDSEIDRLTDTIFSSLKHLDVHIGQSMGTMTMIAIPYAGIPLATLERTGKRYDDYKAKYGKEPSDEWVLKSASADLATMAAEKLFLKTVGKSFTATTKSQKVGTAVVGAGYEGAQEVAENKVDKALMNKEETTFEDEFTSWDASDTVSAGTGLSMGGAMAGGGAALGTITPTNVGKVIDKVQEATPSRPKADIGQTEKDNIAKAAINMPDDEILPMDQLHNMEASVEDIKGHKDYAAAVAKVTRMKANVAKAMEEMDTAALTKTLGSKAMVEDAIDDALGAGNGIIPTTLEAKLREVAGEYGITAEHFDKIVKDYDAVELEATKSVGGYKTYGKAAISILNSVEPDPRKVEKLVGKLEKFRKSQAKFLAEGSSLIDDVEASINDYNKDVLKGLPGGAIKGQYKAKIGNNEFKVNTETYTKKGKTLYRIQDASRKILEAKERNIAGIDKQLTRIATELKEKGIKSAADSDVVVDTEIAKVPKAVKKSIKILTKDINVDGAKILHVGKDTKEINVLREQSPEVFNTSGAKRVVLNLPALPDTQTGKNQLNKILNELKEGELGKTINQLKADGVTITLRGRNVGPKVKHGKGTETLYGKIRAYLGNSYEGSPKYTHNGDNVTFINDSDAKKSRDEKTLDKKTKVEAKAKSDAIKDKIYSQWVDKGESVLNGDLSGITTFDGRDKDKKILLKTHFENTYKAQQKEVTTLVNALSRLGAHRELLKEDDGTDNGDKIIATAKKEKIIHDKLKKYPTKLVEGVVEGIKKAEMNKDKTTAHVINIAKLRQELTLLTDEDLINAVETKIQEELYELSKLTNDYNAVETSIEDTKAKGLKQLYQYIPKGSKSMDERVATTKAKAEKAKMEGTTVFTPIMNLKDLVKSTSSDTLNTVPVDMMFNSEYTDITSADYVADMVDFIDKHITEADGTTFGTGDTATVVTGEQYTAMDSPATYLLKNADGSVNTNIVMAMKLALDEYISINGKNLSASGKSADDLARMLGIHESAVTREMIEGFGDKGTFKKTLANDIGKAITTKIGLKATKKGKTQFARLQAELGHIAILANTGKGKLLEEVSMTTKEYAKLTGSKPADNDAKVIFIRENLVEGKVSNEWDNTKDTYEKVSSIIQDSPVFRKEPSRKPIPESKRRYIKDGVSKDSTGLQIPTGKKDGQISPKEALDNLSDTKWKSNTKIIKQVLSMDRQALYKWLGYVDPDGMKKLSHYDKAAQDSVNRDIEKSVDELQKILDDDVKGDGLIVYFDWFYSKNGRYMMDSNTINPQTDKLHRFLITPEAHELVYKVGKNRSMIVDGKDVTDMVNYALAQAMGFATDKKNTKKVQGVGNALRNVTKKELVAIKKKVLSGEDIEIAGVELEIEHISHALQALDMMEQLVNGDIVTSSLSAEFDAVTSGFGLKLMQMPIIKDIRMWLEKVGVFSKDSKNVLPSMNDILDQEHFFDSYQTLAKEVKVNDDSMEKAIKAKAKEEKHSPIGILLSNKPEKIVKEYFDVFADVMPGVAEDGSVSGALRSLFKEPFMTFNYSAGIKSIRKALSGNLTGSIVAQLLNGKIDKKSKLAKHLVKIVADVNTFKELKAVLREKQLYTIKTSTGVSLDKYLNMMMDISFGHKVEEIMTKNFEEFIAAHKVINDAFKTMFKSFKVQYDMEVQKLDEVTDEAKLDIIAGLRTQFPLIKGPMASDLDEGVGIYDTKSTTPLDGTRKVVPAQTRVDGTQKKIRFMIRDFEAAMSAGSVVPIHYIDGAIMAQVLGGSDIVAIHDAIIPPLNKAKEDITKYNENMFRIGQNYSFIDEISEMMSRINTPSDADAKRYAKVVVRKRYDEDSKKMVEVNLLQAIREDSKAVKELANTVKKARQQVIGGLSEEGVKVGHMAGVPGSMWESNNTAETDTPFQHMTSMPNTDQILFNEIKDRLAEVFPTIKVEQFNNAVDKYGEEIIGKAIEDIVYYDPNKAGLDTLPHEYAHVYIDLLERTPFVNNLIDRVATTDKISRYKAKEKIVTAMGENYVKLAKGDDIGITKNLIDKLWQLVKKLLGNDKVITIVQDIEGLSKRFYEGVNKDVMDFNSFHNNMQATSKNNDVIISSEEIDEIFSSKTAEGTCK